MNTQATKTAPACKAPAEIRLGDTWKRRGSFSPCTVEEVTTGEYPYQLKFDDGIVRPWSRRSILAEMELVSRAESASKPTVDRTKPLPPVEAGKYRGDAIADAFFDEAPQLGQGVADRPVCALEFGTYVNCDGNVTIWRDKDLCAAHVLWEEMRVVRSKAYVVGHCDQPSGLRRLSHVANLHDDDMLLGEGTAR